MIALKKLIVGRATRDLDMRDALKKITRELRETDLPRSAVRHRLLRFNDWSDEITILTLVTKRNGPTSAVDDH